jgi:hypothetical protein
MPTFANNGQQIAAGWNNAGSLANITSLTGVTDGYAFQPVNDRGQYSEGVVRQLTTGGEYFEGYPSVRFISPWISDGQIERLKTTYRGNCTLKHHISESVTSSDVQTSNVIFNLDLAQLQNLERIADGYKDFVWTFIIVEVL